MKSPTLRTGLTGAAIAVGVAMSAGSAAGAINFSVTNLVSDGSVPAVTVDPNLVNPWGVSFAPTSPFWVSDNATGVSTLYNGAGAKVPLTVTIPPPLGGTPPASPTGQVFNNTASDFKIAGTQTAFIFATEDGTISGWAPSFGTTAQLAVNTPATGAVYKGLAIGSSGGNNFLYAANFNTGNVDIYNGAFAPSGSFTDPNVAAGYAPFNVQALGNNLYVTFALQDAAKKDDVSGAGHGYVDVFDMKGTFVRRIASQGGEINSPWGLAIAPSSFKQFAGDLLVGNFGDGTISIFDPLTGTFLGKLNGIDGKPIVLEDLWALTPGNGSAAGSAQKIYFTAGLAEESHGLFGSLSPVPEPSAWALMVLGLGLVGAALRSGRPGRRRVAA
jgi:uncharacterized protein (TIGR03118 family)